MSTSRGAARWIFATSLGFIALGIALPLAFSSPIFALSRAAIERCAGVPADTFAHNPRLATTLAGITGGSIVGKWSLHAAIAWQWSRQKTSHEGARSLTALGLLTWFVIDGASSLLFGAWPNVVMINAAPVLLVIPALAIARRGSKTTSEHAMHAHRASPWMLIASALGIASGLLIAFAGASALFDPWFRALSNSGAHPTLDERAARALSLCFFGPIGGSTAGHFAMMLAIALGPARRREPWAIPACAGSVLAWAIVDSCWSFAAGSSFNVWMINAPATVMLLALTVLAVVTQQRPKP